MLSTLHLISRRTRETRESDALVASVSVGRLAALPQISVNWPGNDDR